MYCQQNWSQICIGYLFGIPKAPLFEIRRSIRFVYIPTNIGKTIPQIAMLQKVHVVIFFINVKTLTNLMNSISIRVKWSCPKHELEWVIALDILNTYAAFVKKYLLNTMSNQWHIFSITIFLMILMLGKAKILMSELFNIPSRHSISLKLMNVGKTLVMFAFAFFWTEW